MPTPSNFRFLRPALMLLAGFLLLRYGLPLMLPFLAGSLLALAAEAPVQFLCRKLSLGRNTASFFCVSFTLLMLTVLGLMLFSGLFQGLRRLAAIAPDLEDTARQGITSLQDWLLSLASAAPEGIRNLFTKIILGLFDSGSTWITQALSVLPGMAAGLLSRITGGFLGFGTAVLSAYLISARLPKLQDWFRRRLPDGRVLPALRRLRHATWGWLKAQAGLLSLICGILLIGFLLLRIPHAPVWAVLIALADAVPMLGTGLVLIPWSIISFLQDNPVRSVGLLGIFIAATLVRSTLEPRLLGQQLGLDPLVTLVALYLGYQLLGFPGLLAAPLLAVTATQLLQAPPAPS